jgi:hypothetical protein
MMLQGVGLFYVLLTFYLCSSHTSYSRNLFPFVRYVHDLQAYFPFNAWQLPSQSYSTAAQMKEIRNEHHILVGIPIRKQPLGRLRRWRKILKRDSREIDLEYGR